jgi:hypothetical protein
MADLSIFLEKMDLCPLGVKRTVWCFGVRIIATFDVA